jgi:hypothetical protein
MSEPPTRSEKRGPTNSELRLRRLTSEEPDPAQRGIFELFREAEQEPLDEDAPLAREGDDSAA